MRAILKIAALVPLLVWSISGARAAELIMLEQDGCAWCERWDAEIGTIYPKTAEGKRAPLRKIDIHEKLPADLSGLKTGAFTPTFVLLDKGKEVGRIRGYPGEDFFWGLLGQMLKKISPQQTELNIRNALKYTG